MKLQVIVKNSGKAAGAITTIEAIVGMGDTPLSLLERVASMTNTLCFPDQTLRFNGKDLLGSTRLSAYGVKDGDVLEFAYQASDDTLVKQLSELLGDKALSTEELGLLYVHRHSVPVEDALKAVGHAKGKLQHFLAEQKCFSLAGSLVKVAQVQQPPQALTSPPSLIYVKVDVEIHVPGKEPERQSDNDDDVDTLRLQASETVANAKEIIAAFEQMPFADRDLVLDGQKLEDHISLHDAGVKNGDRLMMVVRASASSLASQLEGLLWERVGLSPNELSLHYCQRFGTPISNALRTLGLHSNVRRFLEAQPQFSIAGGCVTLVNGPKLTTPQPREDKRQGDRLATIAESLAGVQTPLEGDRKINHTDKGKWNQKITVGPPPGLE